MLAANDAFAGYGVVSKAGAIGPEQLIGHSSTYDSFEANMSEAARELLAQEAMATWAFWTFVVGVAGAVTSAAGLALIYRTLHYTRIAAVAARDAVKEAENSVSVANAALVEGQRANAIAHEGMIADLRPWIDVRLTGVEVPRTEGDRYAAKFRWTYRNFGKSTASASKLTFRNLPLIGTDPTDLLVESKVSFASTKSERVIFPGEEGEDDFYCLFEPNFDREFKIDVSDKFADLRLPVFTRLFHLLVCLTYKIEGSDDVGQTSRLYAVCFVPAEDGYRPMPPDAMRCYIEEVGFNASAK